MKKILGILCLAILCHISYGQNWLSEPQKLYYLTNEGKVYVQPDFSSMAVYFDGSPSQEAKTSLRSAMGSTNMKSMSSKEMVIMKQVESSARLTPQLSKSGRLNAVGLSDENAYDILPSFRLNDGQQVWFTKRVSLKLNDGLSQRDIVSVLEKYDAKFIRNTLHESSILVEVEDIENQLELIQALDVQNLIQWGQPDFRVEIVKHNDPLYPEQFQMNNIGGSLDGVSMTSDIDIDALEAWGITTGSSSITVAVIDDGVESHPDLPSLTAGFTPASNGNGTPESDGAHGLACAGIIAAQHNTIGVRGVAPGVDMIAVNIFEGTESIQDLADAFTWSANQGADVISNSWGFSGNCSANLYPTLTNAINDAATNGRGGLGCVILFSSGNDFNSCVSYPGNLASVIAVGAVRPDGAISSYSNQGTDLDIVAPSNDFNSSQTGFIFGVRTTDRTGSLGYGSGDYDNDFGGTSAACPAAAGAAALVLSVNPSLTSSEVFNIIISTADDMGSNGFDNTFGHGRVNAYAAVLAAGGVTDNTAPSVPTGLTASNVGSSSADLSWNASSDDVGVTGYNIYLGGSVIGSVTGTSTTLTGLTSSTNYSIAVSAFDAAGNESGTSSSISITTSTATLSCSTTISSFPYSEGFESGDGWTQVSGDDGDWVRNSGATPSSTTGPSAAAESSFYMFLEASTNGSTGQIGANANAILESGCIDLTSETTATFSFQYHMYGSAMGSLEILASTDDVTWLSLWSESGDQGNSWSSEDLDLSSFLGGVVKLRISGTTGSSWRSDVAVDDLSITTSTSGDGGCIGCIDFNEVTITSYSNQDADGDYDILDDGSTILLEENTWKRTTETYSISSNSILEFDFASTSQGEIHAVGFDEDNNLSSNRIFKLHGTQNYGITDYDNYSGSSYVTYSIAVGGEYTGSAMYLVLTNDNDAGSGNNSYFSNMRLYDGGSSNFSFNSLETELHDAVKFNDLTVYPNPAKNQINLSLEIDGMASMKIFNLDGKEMKYMSIDQAESTIDVSDLNTGIYLLHVRNGNHIMVSKISIL